MDFFAPRHTYIVRKCQTSKQKKSFGQKNRKGSDVASSTNGHLWSHSNDSGVVDSISRPIISKGETEFVLMSHDIYI
jgi:hypothetical protein